MPIFSEHKTREYFLKYMFMPKKYKCFLDYFVKSYLFRYLGSLKKG